MLVGEGFGVIFALFQPREPGGGVRHVIHVFIEFFVGAGIINQHHRRELVHGIFLFTGDGQLQHMCQCMPDLMQQDEHQRAGDVIFLFCFFEIGISGLLQQVFDELITERDGFVLGIVERVDYATLRGRHGHIVRQGEEAVEPVGKFLEDAFVLQKFMKFLVFLLLGRRITHDKFSGTLRRVSWHVFI